MTIVASAQITLLDLMDVVKSPTAPVNPIEDVLWWNTTDNKAYIYQLGTWKPSSTGALSSIDLLKDTRPIITDLSTSLDDLGNDSKITRFERSLVRGDLAYITGKRLDSSDVMPTLTSIDSGEIGSLFAVRKVATNLGLSTVAGSNYDTIGKCYTDLASLLNGMSPKPWDTSASSSSTISVEAAAWHTKWKAYHDAYTLLNIEIQDKQKAYADAATSNSQSGAIAAAQSATSHQTVNITNPVTINAPVATIGLPEFQGRHTDSWKIDRNFILGSATPYHWEGVLGLSSMQTLNLDTDTISLLNGATITISMSYKLTNVTYGKTNPWLGMRLLVGYSDGTQTAFDIGGGVTLGVGSTDGYKVIAATYTLNASKVIASLKLTWGGTDLTGSIDLRQPKIELGKKLASQVIWTQAPQEAWAQYGNRIKPVTSPTFSTGTDLKMNVALYGDETTNDSVAWDMSGNLVKTQYWYDITLGSKQPWTFSVDSVGYKQVKSLSFSVDATNNTVQAVKYDGAFLTTKNGQTATDADQVSLSGTDNTLYITIKDTDSGWGESYTPTDAEISAYFNGWRMCNGAYNSPYTGSGTKTWYPIGDTNLSRAASDTENAPTVPAPTLAEHVINGYQVVYRANTPVQVVGEPFDGILSLIQGSNTVNIYYPVFTPPIVKGTIKYATTLATATQDVTYVIPTIQKRVATAESKVTDEAIVNAVTSSVSYQTALSSKANAADLVNYASQDSVDGLSGSVDGLAQSVGDIEDSLSTFVTSASLTTTADGIKESFYKGGGMNLSHNSVGYAKTSNEDGTYTIDFWDDFSPYQVETIQTDVLDQLGFGSGFYFKADGHNKGISQTIKVFPGQHYVLSWYLNKTTSGGDSSYRFFIQVLEDGTIVEEVADNSGYLTNGFEASYMKYTASPTASAVTIRFIGYGNVEAMLTGIMFTIGDVPLQWTLATGEAYNTNIRMNINGIVVSQLDGNGKEVGFTQITPTEFAGYHSTNNDGTFEKVFYLNGDETVTKKITAKKEITMGNIKIIPISSATNTGWAFIADN